MKIDLLFVQFAIIFLPGLIWAGLDSRYALKSKPSEFQYILRAFLFGMASYGITFGLYAALGWPFSLADISEAATKGLFTPATFKEIAATTFVGLVLAILWLYASNYKWDTRFLQKIRATKTYGDEDVWDFTFNSPIAAVEYVHFRDFANKIVYAGWVKEFSETEKLRELVLRDAQIYDFEGNLLFETPLVYLARDPENIHVEFPFRAEEIVTDRKLAQDGYSKPSPLSEGYIRKGGSNNAVSQIQTRPAPPAPMHPPTSQGGGRQSAQGDTSSPQGNSSAPKK